MKILIDSDTQTLSCERPEGVQQFPLFSPEAFNVLSREWVRIGWALRHYHTFSWFGQPILQLPEDLIRLQEVIFAVKPDLIVETGVFQGGSLLFHASLCEAIGKGRVLGIDVEITQQTRDALSASCLAKRISIIEGDSTAKTTFDQVQDHLDGAKCVMVILDSNHTTDHVARELELYAPLVTPGSYVLVADGIMRDLADVPRADSTWAHDNPAVAAQAFAASHPEFEYGQPPWLVHDSPLRDNITYWPDGWLRRREK